VLTPLFSFCIAEGYIHTRDRKKYILRLGIFALVSEVPFDLAFEGKINLSHQNIMLTFFLAVIGLKVFDLIRGEIKVNTGIQSLLLLLFSCSMFLRTKLIFSEPAWALDFWRSQGLWDTIAQRVSVLFRFFFITGNVEKG